MSIAVNGNWELACDVIASVDLTLDTDDSELTKDPHYIVSREGKNCIK